MPRPRTAAAFALAVAATLLLAACAQPTPHVIPTSEPSIAPVFKSDAEALAAAKKAYVAYSSTSDLIGADGGKNPERISKWVTSSDLAVEVKVFDSFAKTGGYLTGVSVITSFSLQQIDQSRSGRVTVTAYACDDVSGSRLFDKSGADVTPVARKPVVPLQVSFRNSRPGSKTLLIDGSEPWSGANFCS